MYYGLVPYCLMFPVVLYSPFPFRPVPIHDPVCIPCPSLSSFPVFPLLYAIPKSPTEVIEKYDCVLTPFVFVYFRLYTWVDDITAWALLWLRELLKMLGLSIGQSWSPWICDKILERVPRHGVSRMSWWSLLRMDLGGEEVE